MKRFKLKLNDHSVLKSEYHIISDHPKLYGSKGEFWIYSSYFNEIYHIKGTYVDMFTVEYSDLVVYKYD